MKKIIFLLTLFMLSFSSHASLLSEPGTTVQIFWNQLEYIILYQKNAIFVFWLTTYGMGILVLLKSRDIAIRLFKKIYVWVGR